MCEVLVVPDNESEVGGAMHNNNNQSVNTSSTSSPNAEIALIDEDDERIDDSRRISGPVVVEYVPSLDDGSNLVKDDWTRPNGGWGWMIVLAAFFMNFIIDGLSFNLGSLFLNFLEKFGEGHGRTAWIVSSFMAMPLISGPFAGFLTDYYGCQKVTMSGGLLAAVGFLISAYCESMIGVFLSFGVLSGFGISLCGMTSVVSVAYYFDKSLSFASGISVSGSGIGTIVFPKLMQRFSQCFSLSGTISILGGILLNLCVCGALMRELPECKERLKAKRLARRKKMKMQSQPQTLSSTDSKTALSYNEPELLARANPRVSRSLVCIPTIVTSDERALQEVSELTTSRRSVPDSDRIDELVVDPPLAEMEAGPSTRKVILPLRGPRHLLNARLAMMSINQYKLRARSCPNMHPNSMNATAHDNILYKALWETRFFLSETFDFSYFRDTRFLLFAISNFLLYTWYDIPYVYLFECALQMGFTEADATLLIQVIGVLSLIGEIGLGYIGDRQSVNTTLVYAVCMVFCGIATCCLSAFGPDYNALLLFGGAFGLFIAANYSLCTVILVELITIDRFTNAYGVLLMVQGVANLIGPPIAGMILDSTHSYNLTFLLAGTFIMLSGFMLLVRPTIVWIRQRKAKKLQKASLPATATDTTSNENTLPLNDMAESSV